MSAYDFAHYLDMVIAKQGFSVRDVAKALKQRGYTISHTTLTRWRNGTTVPKVDKLPILRLFPAILGLGAMEAEAYKQALAKYTGESLTVHNSIHLVYRKHYVGGQVGFFAGREQEMTQLHEAITNRQHILISGIGGSGKSTLAWKGLEEHARQFTHGYDSIRVGTLSTSRVVIEVGQRFGVHLSPASVGQDTAQALDQIRQAIYGIELLFLLDDVDSVGQVLPIMTGLSGITWILTSRRHLFSSHINFAHIPLDVPPLNDATHILLHHAGASTNHLAQQTLSTIAQRLGSLPIMLRLCGQLVRHNYVADLPTLSQWLDEKGMGVLQLGEWNAPTFFGGILSMVSASTTLALFEACGIFSQPIINYLAFQMIISELGATAGDLKPLEELSLIEVEEKSQLMRLHPLIHEYAMLRFGQSTYKDEIVKGYTNFYGGFARQHKSDVVALSPEITELLVAHRFARELEMWPLWESLVRTIGEYYWKVSDWEAYLNFETSCLEGAQVQGDRFREASLLGEIGWVTLEQKRIEEAEAFFVDSLSIWQVLNEVEAVARSYRYLGILRIKQNRLDESEKLLQQAEAIIRQHEQDIGGMEQWMWQSVSLTNHAYAEILQLRGEYESAQKIEEAALQFNGSSGQVGYRPMILLRLGGIMLQQGNVDEARKIWQESVRNYLTVVNELRVSAATLFNLEQLERHLGNEKEAAYWASVAENAFTQNNLLLEYQQAKQLIEAGFEEDIYTL